MDGLFVSTFAIGYAGSDHGTVNLTQALTIDPNTVTGSLVDGVGVKTVLRNVNSAVQFIAMDPEDRGRLLRQIRDLTTSAAG